MTPKSKQILSGFPLPRQFMRCFELQNQPQDPPHSRGFGLTHALPQILIPTWAQGYACADALISFLRARSEKEDAVSRRRFISRRGASSIALAVAMSLSTMPVRAVTVTQTGTNGSTGTA